MDELEDLYTKFSYPYVEVRRHSINNRIIHFLNGNPVGGFFEKETGYSLRFFQGTLYFSSSKNPKELGSKTYPIHGWEQGFSSENPEGGKYEVKERKGFDSVSLEDKTEVFLDAYKRVKVIPQLKNLSVTYIESLEEKEILVNGVKVSGRVPRIGIFISAVIKEGDRSATARFELGKSGGLEVLEESNLPEFVEEKIKEVLKVLQKGRSFGEKRTDVVLSNMLSGIMAHESVGHPFEADRIAGREFAQAGTSYLSVLKGDKIGSEAVNVIDDPTIPGSYGFYLIDDEGVLGRPKYLIKEGKKNELLTDRFSANRIGTTSNGSARASSFDREPLVRMSNTFFKPGNLTFDELVEDVKEGVFIKSYMEWNIDDMRLGERYVGLEAYEIRDGEVQDPVIFPVLEGKTTDLLSSVDAVDNTLEFYPGTCGKGDPDQGVPVWLGGPNMRFRNVKVKVM
ncbi:MULTISPECIES: TldD/PmbA family protein [Acidianus]|uniref:Peptidase U62 n=1 Tax=Candidatus Acidianus copahuensis TaxID=1160895 RepID=A0A031LNR4_9CREN|nr:MULTISPECIES: TldD/PmbA family protein [Acidianus]EZQ06651.1 peptidase U62 [Candidatus Acidianus copahuensis]NON61905.1 TldD/PmbA family protein [Acidianus sp. RZ1]